MVKRKPLEAKVRRSRSQSVRSESKTSPDESAWFSNAAIRETIESVIIAFVLAFLFRTFEAEAFVIPTGSMAPTLMGKHKDLACPMCGYWYPVSASDDQRDETPANVRNSICPMCGFRADLGPNNPQKKSYLTYDGDRILVAKFPYELAEPKRWDIIVFKFPGNSTMNYIKRLVGLPGETIRIHDGDLWIHKPGQPQDFFEIGRKPPEKILAMLQPVYDNDLAPTITGKFKWPARWTPGPDAGWSNGKGSSKENPADLSSFEIDQSTKAEAWIRYNHRVPTYGQWDAHAVGAGIDAEKLTRDSWIEALKSTEASPESVPRRLISDFTAYDSGNSQPAPAEAKQSEEISAEREKAIDRNYGLHWVGDLALQFELESKSASGKVIADLVKGGHHFRCAFDLANGDADLTISGDESEAKAYHRNGKTPVVGVGRHAITFANVDDELTLWVDGKVVALTNPNKPQGNPASGPEQHPNGYDSEQLNDHVPTEEDLSPAGIGAEMATVKVSHIKILRDVYYIAVFKNKESPDEGPMQDFISLPDLKNDANWKRDFTKIPNGNMKTCEIRLNAADPAHQSEKDQFFVLGDNSAQSSDGRLWAARYPNHPFNPEYWVDRELLIGKALFIYWPHGWGYVPLPNGGYVNPIPNFGRMHLVR
jgi:signal peptidase I